MTDTTSISASDFSDQARAIARAIVVQHEQHFAGFDAQPVPQATQTGDVYIAALHACSQLGFIACDAETLAVAWQKQSSRTGQFDAAAWPSHAADFGLLPRPHSQPFPAVPQALGLYAVLPDAEWVKNMAQAGMPTVQLRFKSDDAKAIEQEIWAAVEAVEGTSALLFINDHWQAAIRAGAYGVHLGQEDLDALSPQDLQTLRDSGLRLGVSTHGYAEMQRADQVSPSYIALGAVFPTTLKRMATAPQGVARLQAYVDLMQGYPLVAIGGIAGEQFAQIKATGVGSIAVVRALVNAEKPQEEARRLMALLAG